jgi:hypothetical protein
MVSLKLSRILTKYMHLGACLGRIIPSCVRIFALGIKFWIGNTARIDKSMTDRAVQAFQDYDCREMNSSPSAPSLPSSPDRRVTISRGSRLKNCNATQISTRFPPLFLLNKLWTRGPGIDFYLLGSPGLSPHPRFRRERTDEPAERRSFKVKSCRPDSKSVTSTTQEALLLSLLDSLALPRFAIEVIELEISGLKFNPGIDDGFVYRFAVGVFVWPRPPGLILRFCTDFGSTVPVRDTRRKAQG